MNYTPTLEAIDNSNNFTRIGIWIAHHFDVAAKNNIKKYAYNRYIMHCLLITPHEIIYLDNVTPTDINDWTEVSMVTTEVFFKILNIPRMNISDLTKQVVSLLYFIKNTSSFKNNRDLLFDIYNHLQGNVDIYLPHPY